MVLARFSREPQSRPSTSESSRSILGAEDWRKIKKLLQDVVEEVYSENTKKLTLAMHNLSTENILLKLQYEGLQIALQNEKKKRQRGKPLQFQLQAPDDGGAVFYSPQKIQQARDFQLEKERAAEQLKTSREEQKVRRQQEKEAKQRLVEDRKKIRASQRELRRLEAQQKRQEKEDARIAKEAAKQLQINFQQAKKSPRKSSKASNHEDPQDTGPPSHEVVEEVRPTVVNRGSTK